MVCPRACAVSMREGGFAHIIDPRACWLHVRAPWYYARCGVAPVVLALGAKLEVAIVDDVSAAMRVREMRRGALDA